MSTLQNDRAEDPRIMLDWSDDHGKTWSNQISAAMGKSGEYLTRAKFYRLGASRDRIYRVSISDPVKRVITSANLDAQGCLN